jgi:hypothetical protein
VCVCVACLSVSVVLHLDDVVEYGSYCDEHEKRIQTRAGVDRTAARNGAIQRQTESNWRIQSSSLVCRRTNGTIIIIVFRQSL